MFISYRRADSAAYAGRLADALSRHFGADQVFFDRDGIDAGARFPAAIQQALDSCQVLLALIGPGWLKTHDEAGRRRLDDPRDFVRREIATALGRSEVLVIPILLNTATMPAASHLPKLLAGLAERNTRRLGDESWREQIDGLITDLEKLVPRVAERSVTGGGVIVVGSIPGEPAAFVTRETAGRLARALDGSPVAVVCALTGMRGVGKTQLAAAYARSKVAGGGGFVAWVNAETLGELLAGLAELADRLGVGDPEGDSLQSARRLRTHLAEGRAAGLLVFDNATDPDRLRELVPTTGATQIVITSTDRAVTALGKSVDVDRFDRQESLHYLRERTEDDDAEGAVAVAEELVDLPVGGPARRGDRAVRADPGRVRAGAGPRPPRHPNLAPQPRPRTGSPVIAFTGTVRKTFPDRARPQGGRTPISGMEVDGSEWPVAVPRRKESYKPVGQEIAACRAHRRSPTRCASDPSKQSEGDLRLYDVGIDDIGIIDAIRVTMAGLVDSNDPVCPDRPRLRRRYLRAAAIRPDEFE